MQRKEKLIKGIILLAVALIILVVLVPIASAAGSNGYGFPKYNYGGDAYTGIQNAAAQTANNTYHLNKTIRTCTAVILTAASLTLAGLGVSELVGSAEAKYTQSVDFPKKPTLQYQTVPTPHTPASTTPETNTPASTTPGTNTPASTTPGTNTPASTAFGHLPDKKGSAMPAFNNRVRVNCSACGESFFMNASDLEGKSSINCRMCGSYIPLKR